MNYDDMFQKLLNYGESEMYRLMYTMDHPELIDESLSLIQQIVNCDEQTSKLLYVDFSKHIKEYDETHKEEIERDTKILKEFADSLIEKEKHKPTCPICGSTNLTKLSNVGKAAKVGFFGIFGAGDLGKTWKCKNCGSKF